jgi:hypothetical protein
MDQPQRKNLRLLFARQDKLHLSCACMLTLNVPSDMDEEAALGALKKATVAWFDAESANALHCQRYAGIDANIGDLDAHGAFGDPTFLAALGNCGIKFETLVFIEFDCALPYDTPLFEATEEPAEEVPA